MTRKYLRIADLVPPSALVEFSRLAKKESVAKLFEKYRDYHQTVAQMCEGPEQYTGAIAMLHLIFECLEKALNRETNA